MPKLTVEPVTADRWDDLAELFGPSGAYSGCWCMFQRVSSAEFAENGNAGNKAAMRKLVRADRKPGLIAYSDGKPIGWLSLGPRTEFGRIERSPLFKRIDDEPVWSIVCLFIPKPHRGKGVAKRLIAAAADYAASNGAEIIEAYPMDTKGKHLDHGEASIFFGTQALFEQAGFKVVARRKDRRPMMRKKL